MSRYPAQSGVAAPLLLVLLLVILGGGYYLFSSKTVGLPLSPQSSEPKVELKSEYQNPFDVSTQYLNPFENYKNPFDTIK